MPEKSSDSQNERNKPFSARELYAYKSNAPRSTETILTYLLLLFFKHTKQTFKPVYMSYFSIQHTDLIVILNY